MKFLWPKKEATVIYEDNQATIRIAENDTVTARTKHIDVRYHAIRWGLCVYEWCVYSCIYVWCV